MQCTLLCFCINCQSILLLSCCGYRLVAGRDLPKVETGVRFPLPAQIALYSTISQVHTIFMKLWHEYIAYITDNPEGYWFKRKLYGWGWTPAKPAGWAVLGVYLFFLIGLVWYADTRGLLVTEPGRFIALMVAATALLIIISWRTGEPPTWQWGRPKNDE